MSAAETHSLRVRGLREMTMDEMWEHAMPQRRGPDAQNLIRRHCDETIGGWRLGAGLIAMRYAEFQTSIGALPVVDSMNSNWQTRRHVPSPPAQMPRHLPRAA